MPLRSPLAFTTLEPQDQAIIVTHHIQGKTITEIAQEQNLARSILDASVVVVRFD